MAVTVVTIEAVRAGLEGIPTLAVYVAFFDGVAVAALGPCGADAAFAGAIIAVRISTTGLGDVPAGAVTGAGFDFLAVTTNGTRSTGAGMASSIGTVLVLGACGLEFPTDAVFAAHLHAVTSRVAAFDTG